MHDIPAISNTEMEEEERENPHEKPFSRGV